MRLTSHLWSAAVSLLLLSSSAFGQALVLEKGQFTISTSYSHGFVKYHINSSGVKADLGHIISYAVEPEVSFGLTDRLTLDSDVAFLGARYDGNRPHGRLDDSDYHSTFQDLHFTLRGNLLMRPLFVTPFARLIVPTHQYSREGHTATGKDKFGLTAGLYAGRDFGRFLPNGFFEVMGSQTWVQQTQAAGTANERRNRTNGSLEVGYFLTPALSVIAFGNGARTHGGWNLPRKFVGTEFVEHDQFDKTKYVQAGGSLAYTLRTGLTVYAGYFTTVWARNGSGLAGPTFGFTWSPQPRQTWLASSRRRPTMLLAQR